MLHLNKPNDTFSNLDYQIVVVSWIAYLTAQGDDKYA